MQCAAKGLMLRSAIHTQQITARYTGSPSTREHRGERSSSNPPLLGAQALHTGHQEALLFTCSSALSALP